MTQFNPNANFQVNIDVFGSNMLEKQVFSIEKPTQSNSINALVFEFTGFLIRRKNSAIPKARNLVLFSAGARLQVVNLDIARRDILLDEYAMSVMDTSDIRCGFSTTIPVFLSRSNGSLDIVVEHEIDDNGYIEPYKIASLSFNSGDIYKGSLSQRERKIGIISVNSIGRSGSTLLSRMLGETSECYCPLFMAQFGELSVVDYYLRAIHTLSNEGSPSDLNKLNSGNLSTDLSPGFLKPDSSEEGHEKTFHSNLMRAASERSVEMLWDAVSCLEQYISITKPSASYWVEKQWVSRASNLGYRLFPTWKEIILVRDIREFWKSQYYFLLKLHFDYNLISEHMKSTWVKYDELFQCAIDRQDQSLVVRYEDLISNTVNEMERIFSYLGISIKPSAIQHIAGIVTSEDNHSRESRTKTNSSLTLEAFDQASNSVDNELKMRINEGLNRYGYTYI